MRETGEKYGFEYQEMRDFKTRYNKNQKKLAAGIAIKPKGRPRKDGSKLPPSVQQLSKLSQLQYKLASKNRYLRVFHQQPISAVPSIALRLPVFLYRPRLFNMVHSGNHLISLGFFVLIVFQSEPLPFYDS